MKLIRSAKEIGQKTSYSRVRDAESQPKYKRTSTKYPARRGPVALTSLIKAVQVLLFADKASN
jgi:hypothetical protein